MAVLLANEDRPCVYFMTQLQISMTNNVHVLLSQEASEFVRDHSDCQVNEMFQLIGKQAGD